MPAFLYWRGALRQTLIQERISFLDWFPTFASLAGADVEERWKIEGRNMWPVLKGEKATIAPPMFYWHTDSAQGLLEGDWKLIVPASKGSASELYDLAADPFERKNLAGEHPSKVISMRNTLAECLSRSAAKEPRARE